MTLGYPRAAALGDLARAGVGLALTAGPLAALPLASLATLALGAGAAVFAVFAAHAARRLHLRVEVDGDGLTLRPGGRRLDWSTVREVKLAYYSVRRDGEQGWFELVVRGAGARLRVDSRIDGFDRLVDGAVRAAAHAGVRLDRTTEENVAAVQIRSHGSATLG